MGHVPVPPSLPRDPALWPASHVARLERVLRGRSSMFRWRRRRAYQSCLLLIRHREAVIAALSMYSSPREWNERVTFAPPTRLKNGGDISLLKTDGECVYLDG